MYEVGSNAFEVKIVPLHVAALDKETRTKLVKLPHPKVSQTKKGTMPTCMKQMLLLDQMDLHRLKQELDTKDDCHTHACKNCRALLKIPQKANKSAKKGSNSRSYNTVCV